MKMIEKMNFGASVFANLRRWNQLFLSKVQIKKKNFWGLTGSDA